MNLLVRGSWCYRLFSCIVSGSGVWVILRVELGRHRSVCRQPPPLHDPVKLDHLIRHLRCQIVRLADIFLEII